MVWLHIESIMLPQEQWKTMRVARSWRHDNTLTMISRIMVRKAYQKWKERHRG
jgi:hypothetical protein